MTKIHYFPRYSQRENFSTNNTLLLLYRIYDRDRIVFGKALSELLKTADTDVATSLEFGLQMVQQLGNSLTVPDGCLFQSPLRIVIETKMNARNFGYEQLSGHLSTFKKDESGWLMLLSPDKPHLAGENWEKLRHEGIKRGITIIALTFQQIISALRSNLMAHNEELQALVDDYEEFCSTQQLLPVDEWTIFAPPCGRSFEINRKERLYFCPLEWSRRRGKYLGIYYLRSIRMLGLIEKVLHFDVDAGKLLNSDVAAATPDEIRRMSDAARTFGLAGDYQFYMCREMVDCDFARVSPGGIMGHRYLNIKNFLPDHKYTSLKALAADLSKKTWGDATDNT